MANNMTNTDMTIAFRTEECAHCGEVIQTDRKHWRVHMSTAWENVPEHYAGDDSQGTFAVGPRCRRRYAHAFRCTGFDD